ncbi:YciI family protein [Nocardia sp. NPDC050435]|uniref:YciI family protein n=1 Tax=Nocardia sp. NPDC050435 TaxID=3155040 RepID=UPI0033FBD440
MFILLNTYTAPLDRIDELLPEHRAWVHKHFAAGDFFIGGRREPRTGGFVIAFGDDKAAIEDILAQDPLVGYGVVEWHIEQVEVQLSGNEAIRDALAEHNTPTEVPQP